jgi:cation diffusion facilitator CzcD-associated flavoprotein CzcO
MTDSDHVDVLVVGAGLSGIAAGYHVQKNCPGRTYAILESREVLGGTWDLFRYPGIRSDSDMYTLGYSFRPWVGAKAIADGPSILSYIQETAREHGIDKKIRFGHRVEKASWSSKTSLWTIEARRTDTNEVVRLTCRFLLMCSGYYDYQGGYTPDFAGTEQFRGRIVHPQKWTDDVDYEGKRVVVIGSGATAVTLVPELAKKAAHVTMLQRSPTYVISIPAVDGVAKWLGRRLPTQVAYDVSRWKNVALSMAMFNFCRRFPAQAEKLIASGVRKGLGPDFDIATHFTPSYKPWDQRVCLVPDGDLFEAIKNGSADVVTDHIVSFTETGLKLKSGKTLEADVVVTATGLKLLVGGGVQVVVDDQPVEVGKTMNYKGTMLSDVPNFAIALGYTNASWTLKCDLVCEFVCRLLNHMERGGFTKCAPRVSGDHGDLEPLINFSSGYIQRSIADLPKQGARAPWRLYQNYLLDLFSLRYGAVADGVIEFSRAASPS